MLQVGTWHSGLCVETATVMNQGEVDEPVTCEWNKLLRDKSFNNKTTHASQSGGSVQAFSLYCEQRLLPASSSVKSRNGLLGRITGSSFR